MHRFRILLIIFFFPLSLFPQNSKAVSESGKIITSFNRTSFPPDFLFGSGGSAYQTEGSPLKYGRGVSIWDEYTKVYPERVVDGSTGETTTDFYNKYKEDIQLAKKIGLDTFRMSISWSRVIPSGVIKRGVNNIGVMFYNQVINEIIANGMKPFVTLYHFDTPQALEEEYGGPLSSSFVNDFKEYADFCFKTYGDRAKLWTTINEPNIFTKFGYAATIIAPGRCTPGNGNCASGDSATEPYIVSHHLLLAHATAANLYKTKYQATQKGEIGGNVAATWFYPLNDTLEDRQAASRAQDFEFGRILHPLIVGDYPESVKKLVGKRLPTFTEEQSKMLIASQDFLTLNYYTSFYAYDDPSMVNNSKPDLQTDGRYGQTGFRNGVALGEQSASQFSTYPKGLYLLLKLIKDKYKNPKIYITENGYSTAGKLALNKEIKDKERITYIKGHLKYTLKAIQEGCYVKGYSVWALTDNWEWSSGFTKRYGLIQIDFKTLTRYLKASALWYKKFLLH